MKTKKNLEAAQAHAEKAMQPVWGTFPDEGTEWNDTLSDAIGEAAWDAVAAAYRAGVKASMKAIRGIR